MTHALIAAKSGWGKSWLAQWWLEDNIENYPHVVVLDRRDEFRGLVKSGDASHMIVGPREADVSSSAWQDFIVENGRTVLARYRLNGEDWTRVAAEIAHAAMNVDDDVLVLIDEAHKVAPEKGTYPDALETLATEGRGSVASVWVTQRLAKLDETPISEMMMYLLGGFKSDSDVSKAGRNIGYSRTVHKVGEGNIGGLSQDLHAPDSGPVPLRKFTENGQVVGSEWIYSDDDGKRRRINTRDLDMESTHYGPESLSLSIPGK